MAASVDKTKVMLIASSEQLRNLKDDERSINIHLGEQKFDNNTRNA